MDDVVTRTMSSCVSSQPSSDRATPQDGSSEGPKPCEALQGLSSLSLRLGMESFIVVTECEPCSAVDLGLTRDRPLEADGREVSPDTSRSQARPHLSGRKLSLQERSPAGPAASSSLDANGRCICPSLPYSPVGSPQSSPRLPRRPTVESHHVSITGLQVCGPRQQGQGRNCCPPSLGALGRLGLPQKDPGTAVELKVTPGDAAGGGVSTANRAVTSVGK